MRCYDTPPDEQQTEGSRKQTKAAQRADLLHNNRSAANLLAKTIGAASSSTQEAQVESTVSPTPLCERRSQPESAAGKPTPLSAPQAGIFRSGPRATRFAAAALLSSLGSRSCCSQQRSSSTACRSRACERASLLFTTAACASDFLLVFFFGEGGMGRGAHERIRRGGSGEGRASSHEAPAGRAGRRPPCPNGAPLENFGGVARREEAAEASRWGLGPKNRPSGRCAENTGAQRPGIFRSVSGPNSHGKPPNGRSQGRGGRWRPLRPSLARDPSPPLPHIGAADLLFSTT